MSEQHYPGDEAEELWDDEATRLRRHDQALHLLRRIYRDVVRLSSAVGPLGDPYALAHVDLCISMLGRLHEHLEAQAKNKQWPDPQTPR